jgi:C4-dicarboxylate transporter DctQ subunit
MGRRFKALARAVAFAYRILQGAGLFLACVASLLIVVVMLREVIGRYGFNAPTGWADEVAGYLVAGLAFLGVAASVRSGQMLSVTLFTERIRQPWRDRAEGVAYLLSLAMGCLVLWFLADFALENFESGRATQSALLLKLWIPQAVLSAGLLLLLMELACQAFLKFFRPEAAVTVSSDQLIEDELAQVDVAGETLIQSDLPQAADPVEKAEVLR